MWADLKARTRRFLQHLVPERLWVTWTLLRHVWSRAYPLSGLAVRAVATDTALMDRLGKDLRAVYKTVVLKQAQYEPQTGENAVRMVNARVLTEDLCRGVELALTPAQRNLLAELAYFAYKARA